MATLTESDDTREDQRGKELAEKSTPLDQHGAKPLSGTEKDKLDDIEKGLAGGDAAAGPKSGGAGSGSSGSSGGAANSGGGNRFSQALKGVGGFAGRHKRGLLAGGGIGGIVITIMLSFIAILPARIESMMKTIFEKRVGQYAERPLESTIDKLAQTYFLKNLQAGPEGDAAADKEFDKLIVSQGHLTKDILKTWRTNKFATNLEKNQGLKFQRGSKTGTVDVYQDGKLMGNYGSADSRQLVRDAIRNQTKWYQFYKRHHLRVWMKNALNIQSWKFFKGTSGGDDAKTEIRTGLVDAATVAYGDEVVKVLDCALEDTCDPNNQKHDDSSDQELRQGIEEADQSAADAVKGPGSKTLLNTGLTKLFGQTFADKITGLMAKFAGPVAILGVVDVFSRFDHFFYTGNADKAIADMHKAELASQFAQWSTINDQIKDGTAPDGKKVTGDEVNAIMEQTGDPAKSAGFQQLYLGRTDGGGQKLGTANDGSDQSASHSVNEKTTPIKDEYIFLASGGDPSGFGANVSHDILNAWYQTGGKVMNYINDAFGLFMDLAEKIIPGLQSLMDGISNFALHFILKFLTPAVNGAETDGELFNNLDAGGAVVGQAFMQNIGGAAITTSETNSINEEIADSQAAETKKLSVADRIFSTDYDNSLVNTLALMVPSSPSDAVNQTAGYMASIFTNPMQWFGRVFGTIPTPFNSFATAAAPADLYGLNHYDFTNSDLSQPIDDKDLDTATQNAATRLSKSVDDITPDDVTLEDCPDTGDKANLCKLDLVALQSVYANETNTDNGGVNNGGN